MFKKKTITILICGFLALALILGCLNHDLIINAFMTSVEQNESTGPSDAETVPETTAPAATEYEDTTKPEETQPVGPSVTGLKRNELGYVVKATYTFTVIDPGCGIQSVQWQPEGKEAIELSGIDGIYTVTVTSNGDYVLTVTDNNGNDFITSVTEEEIDAESPVISDISRAELTWANTTEYTFKVFDGISGVVSVTVQIDNKEPFEVVPIDEVYSFTIATNSSFTIVAKDAAGNTDTFEGKETKIDSEAPVINDLSRIGDSWQQEVQYTFTVVDIYSGVQSVTLSSDANNDILTVTPSEDGSYSVTLKINAVYTITAKDAAGNNSTLIFKEEFVDEAAPDKPDIQSTADGWTNNNVTLTIQSEDKQSGILGYWYSTEFDVFDRETWTQLEIVDGVVSMEMTEEQDITYYVIAEDNVGRISETAAMRVAIDKTLPTAVKGIFDLTDGSGFYTSRKDGYNIFRDFFRFKASASDSASGIAYFEYRIVSNDKTVQKWTKVTAENGSITSIVKELPDGYYSVYFRAYDAAGNVSDETAIMKGDAVAAVILENTPQSNEERNPAPIAELRLENGKDYDSKWTADTVVIWISGSSAISGIEGYEYMFEYEDPALEDSKWQFVKNYNGDYKIVLDDDTNATIRVRAITNAANYTKEVSSVVKVAKSAPLSGLLTFAEPTGTNGWYTYYPEYDVTLPDQNPYMPDVHYLLRYSYNGSILKDLDYAADAPMAIDKDGTWTFCLVSVDAVGNTAVGATVTLKIDTAAPTNMGISLEGGNITNINEATLWWNKVNYYDQVSKAEEFLHFRNESVTLTVTANGGDSGMASIYYQILTNMEDYDTRGLWKEVVNNTVRISNEGKYHVVFKAIDRAGNVTYFSGEGIIIDKTAPGGATGSGQLTVQADLSQKSDYGFYAQDVRVNISVVDVMVGDDKAFSGIQKITFRVLADGNVTQSGQLYPGTGTAVTTNGYISGWTGSIMIDAEENNSNNVVVEVTAIDCAGNVKVTSTGSGSIRIDQTAPVVRASYDNNAYSATYGGVYCYQKARALTVVCTETNFIARNSFVNVLDLTTGTNVAYNWTSNGDIHTAQIPVTRDGNYEVTVSITDAAGNKTEEVVFAAGTQGSTRFIVDQTAPRIAVTHHVAGAVQGEFFNRERTATISVTEQNFDPAKMNVKISFQREDGTWGGVKVSKWTTNGATHTATLTFDEDATYYMEVSGRDAANNNATDVRYIGEAAQKWTIDTDIQEPIFETITEGGAYNSAVIPIITAVDKHLEDLTIRLYYTTKDGDYIDVSNSLITNDTMVRDVINNGVKATLDIFPEIEDFDGIYTLVATCSDTAGNSKESIVSFSINRFGSVYFYDTSLAGIMNHSVQKVTNDLVITEYNPSGLIDGTAKVTITKDGTPIADPAFEVTSNVKKTGWYEYGYVISSSNFQQDGTYEVVVSTEDKAGNLPENTDTQNYIRFSVDTQKPNLASVLGMEKAIINAQQHQVTMGVMDNIGIDQIIVFVDELEIAKWDAINDYQGEYSFAIPQGMDQHIRIVVIDIAGNILDTDDETFQPGYDFERDITVSTNFFTRFYANKTLFYGSIGLVALTLLIIVIWLAVSLRKLGAEEFDFIPVQLSSEENQPVEGDLESQETLGSNSATEAEEDAAPDREPPTETQPDKES